MCRKSCKPLPVVTSFFFSLSLRTGCFITLFYTSIRSSIFIAFILIAMLETFVIEQSEGFFTSRQHLVAKSVYWVFFSYQLLIIAEVFVLVFCTHLAYGLFSNKEHHLGYFLVCGLLSWVQETACLVLLGLHQMQLLQYYLLMLLLIIMELYMLVVVYSHYVKLTLETQTRKRIQERRSIRDPFLRLVYNQQDALHNTC